MTVIEREAHELAREHCTDGNPGVPCATCLERARLLVAGCTAMDGSPIGNRGAVDLLRDVADSGVKFEDPRVNYVEVQIDVDTWEALAVYRAGGSSDA